jgi:hypothetical protein
MRTRSESSPHEDMFTCPSEGFFIAGGMKDEVPKMPI